MKALELKRKLKELGWVPCNNGSKHEKWTNGKHTLAIPRQKEIAGKTAYKLIKQAENYNTSNSIITVFQAETRLGVSHNGY
jgi:hypothetical protein